MDRLTANELRIGNFVYVFDNILSQVDWIQNESVSVLYDRQPNLSNGAIVSYGNAKPIPLTEEWLLRMGFECLHANNKHYIIIDPNGLKDLHKISIFPTLNEQWHIAFSDTLNGYQDYIPTTKIKYVHQLQNLYFALTGEELTIKSN